MDAEAQFHVLVVYVNLIDIMLIERLLKTSFFHDISFLFFLLLLFLWVFFHMKYGVRFLYYNMIKGII